MISPPLGKVANVNGFLWNFVIVLTIKLGRIVEQHALELVNRY